MTMRKSDVLIIGAGPAGTVAASMLARSGVSATVIERSLFPRFAIGESLLPKSTEFLEEAGLRETVEAAGFQAKDGATVTQGKQSITLRFGITELPATWQVERARFDDVLASAAQRAGVDIRFGESITAVDVGRGASTLRTTDADGIEREYGGRFVLDASGAGRVLPRQLGLDRPADAPPRAALFAHAADHIDEPGFDRTKSLLAMHPERADVWYWLIPFQDRASVGVVGSLDALSAEGESERRFHAWIRQHPRLSHLLEAAQWEAPVREMKAYAASVRQLHGPGYALLGNAGEAVDPVFSSGVTLAMKSAVLAAPLVRRELDGETVDWNREFERPLRHGARVFHAFIESWYRGELQRILFSDARPESVYNQILSILAGNVWDARNPYTSQTARRLTTLARICDRPA